MASVGVDSEVHVIDPDHRDILGKVTKILSDAQIDVELSEDGGPQRSVPHISKVVMNNPRSAKGTMRWYLNSNDPKIEGASTTLEDPPTIEVVGEESAEKASPEPAAPVGEQKPGEQTQS